MPAVAPSIHLGEIVAAYQDDVAGYYDRLHGSTPGGLAWDSALGAWCVTSFASCSSLLRSGALTREPLRLKRTAADGRAEGGGASGQRAAHVRARRQRASPGAVTGAGFSGRAWGRRHAWSSRTQDGRRPRTWELGRRAAARCAQRLTRLGRLARGKQRQQALKRCLRV
jgi:hypothetical protein